MEKSQILNDFGRRVRLRREELGMSQQELAILMGYKSRSSINKIELGKNDVAQSTIKRLANALRTTPAYLMGWDYDENDTSQELLNAMEELSLQQRETPNRHISLSDLDKYDATTAKVGDTFADGHVMLSDIENNLDGSVEVSFKIDGENPVQDALIVAYVGAKVAGKIPERDGVEKTAYELAQRIVQTQVKDFLDKATPEQRKRFDEEMKEVYAKVYEIFFSPPPCKDDPDK